MTIDQLPFSESSTHVITLAPATKDALFQEYCLLIPLLGAVWSMYQTDIKRHEKRMGKKPFPDFINWEPKHRRLTDQESRMREELDSHAESQDNFTKEDVHSGRMTIFSVAGKKTCQHDSSVVRIVEEDDGGSVTFGCIKEIFRHSAFGNQTMFAILELFDNLHFDRPTNLWTASKETGNITVLNLSKLQKPVPYAIDGEYIWFLN